MSFNREAFMKLFERVTGVDEQAYKLLNENDSGKVAMKFREDMRTCLESTGLGGVVSSSSIRSWVNGQRLGAVTVGQLDALRKYSAIKEMDLCFYNED